MSPLAPSSKQADPPRVYFSFQCVLRRPLALSHSGIFGPLARPRRSVITVSLLHTEHRPPSVFPALVVRVYSPISIEARSRADKASGFTRAPARALGHLAQKPSQPARPWMVNGWVKMKM